MNFRTLAHGCSSLAFCAVLLAACSGGGGGGSPAPTPTPTPTPTPNVAPIARLSAPDGTVVEERQTIRLDASSSSDANGDALSFNWHQTSGPDLGISDPMASQLVVALPEVEQDVEYSFEVTVSDDSLSDTAAIKIKNVNYSRSPLTSGFGPVIEELDFAPDQLVQVSPGPWGTQTAVLVEQALVIRRTPQDEYFLEVLSIPSPSSPPVRTGKAAKLAGLKGSPDNMTFNIWDLDGQITMNLVALNKSTGEVHIFKQTSDVTASDLTIEASGYFKIDGACAVQTLKIGLAANLSDERYLGLEIGTAGNGLVALRNEGNPTTLNVPDAAEIERAGRFNEAIVQTTSGNFCAFETQGVGATIFGDWNAFDLQRNEMVPISRPPGRTPSFGQAIPTGLTGGPYASKGMGIGVGESAWRYRAIGLTDEKHHGEHKIVIFNSNPTAGQYVELIDLPNGTPSQVIPIAFDIDTTITPVKADTSLIVLAPETPYIYILENKSTDTSSAWVFDQIEYMEVPFGVVDIAFLNTRHVSANKFDLLLVALQDGRLQTHRIPN